MNNPFKFYTGKEYDQDNKRATSEVKKEIKAFQERIRGIMDKYHHIGTTDTQSREEIVNFIKKKLDKGGFI